MTEEALEQVRLAAEEYDQLSEKREAFYAAVRHAAETCTLTEIAAQAGRSTTRIAQIVGDRPHRDGRRRVVK